MLLERLEPGVPLTSVRDDEEATSIVAGVLKQLWRPVPPDHPFPTVSEWARGMERLRSNFGGGTGPLPSPLVERAEALFTELLPSQSEPVVPHGDLHHFNVLAAQREPWLAIDPKGIVGEPAYDTGALLHNPTGLLNTSHPGRVLERRIDLLAEVLDLDRSRVRGLSSPAGHMSWTGLVCAVLWRERLKAGHATLNWRVGGAFLMAVVLHALWDTFASLRSATFVEFLGVVFLSVLVAVVSLVLLLRRVREARRAGA
jgi:streptomycin 6-kinase